MPIWSVYPRGNYQSLLGIVNEKNWLAAQAAAEARYGKVREYLGGWIHRDVMVELGATQVIVVSSKEDPKCETPKRSTPGSSSSTT